MKRAVLTCGPRGAGKTTFCKKVIEENQSDIILIERDKILMDIYGAVDVDSYDAPYIIREVAKQVFSQIEKIFASNQSVTVILDFWNGYEDSRCRLARGLKSAGADEVDLWLFTTPLETCLRYFFARQESSKSTVCYGRDGQIHDYWFFHSQRINLDQGFNSIIKINPNQITLLPYAELLL